MGVVYVGGQPRGQRLRPLSYSKSHVILIAFAIDTPDSLENVSVKVGRVVASVVRVLMHLCSGLKR